MSYADFFVLVSLFILVKFLYHWGRTLYALFLARRLGCIVDFKKLGDWAVVTGASDGIGKAFAFELASRGLNVVLIGRDKSKLQSCAREIENQHRVETSVICVDFARDDRWYSHVRDRLVGLKVAVLVNNVGMCPAIPDYFHAMSGDGGAMVDIIRCNVLSVTDTTRICLPGMLQRKSGVIINIASASALLPTPLVAIYSATKTYVDVFSRALSVEVERKGVLVQSLLPFTVQTRMTGNPEISFFVADAREFASSSLDTVGTLRRSHGCFSHSLQGWYFSSLPEWWSSRLQWQFFSQLRSTLLEKTQNQ